VRGGLILKIYLGLCLLCKSTLSFIKNRIGSTHSFKKQPFSYLCASTATDWQENEAAKKRHPMQYFHHDTKSLIWKTVLDPVKRILVLENREDEARQVTFSAIHLIDGRLLWGGMKMEEPWWVSVSAAANGRVFLFEYGDSQYPEPKGITALEAETGELCWQNPELQLEQVGFDEVIAFRVEGTEKAYYLLRASDGEVLQQEQTIMPNLQLPQTDGLLSSVRYDTESLHYTTVARFLEAKTGRQPVNPIDYLEHPKGIVIHYYEKESDNSLSQWLLVSDLKGKVLLDEQTGSGLKGMGMETFMVMDDRLVYIKDKRYIIGYEL